MGSLVNESKTVAVILPVTFDFAAPPIPGNCALALNIKKKVMLRSRIFFIVV
ncbi:hypothetical protein D9M68_592630 [compost metagenome]